MCLGFLASTGKRGLNDISMWSVASKRSTSVRLDFRPAYREYPRYPPHRLGFRIRSAYEKCCHLAQRRALLEMQHDRWVFPPKSRALEKIEGACANCFLVCPLLCPLLLVCRRTERLTTNGSGLHVLSTLRAYFWAGGGAYVWLRKDALSMNRSTPGCS